MPKKIKPVIGTAFGHGMRRFVLERDEDVSGTSGIGVVAEGIEFKTGHCALSWLSPVMSIEILSSITSVNALHGHGGKTKIKWVDL